MLSNSDLKNHFHAKKIVMDWFLYLIYFYNETSVQ